MIEECKHLLAQDRTLVDQPKQLLATSTVSTPKQVRDESTVVANMHKAPESAQETLSILVFQDGSRFGWRVLSPAKQMLGRGTAETELKARVAAFDAGMAYIDRLKGRTKSARAILLQFEQPVQKLNRIAGVSADLLQPYAPPAEARFDLAAS